MSFDALTLAAVRDELEPLLVDARAQKIVFVDELSLAVEFFAPGVGRTFVLLSADLERARVQRIQQLPSRGLERDSPFSLQIRKHLRNARVRSVHQPRLERVFELDCEQRDASGRPYRIALIVEAMGRRSNLVLVDAERVVLDAARRSPPSRNPRRPILPHVPYEPPPPQDRLMPEQLSAESLSADMRERSLAKHLAGRVAGLSPLAARELAFRATGSDDAASADWERVATVARDFLRMADTHTWSPTLGFYGDRPVEFAPYELGHLAAGGARLERFGSISDAMAVYYARVGESGPARRGDQLAAERKALLAPLERTAHTTGRRIAALSHQLESAQRDREGLLRAGDAILVYQAELSPGATELVSDGQHIDLDPTLTPVENAQAYFARYRKAREAEKRVPALLEDARRLAEYLDELRTLVEVADQMDAIRALRREVGAATGSKAPRDSRKSQTSAPYRRIPLTDGWEALVGTSAEGNNTVTFALARADDVWLHARGVPGAHVILRGNSVNPPEEVVERAAQLAAHHSAARQSGAVEVDLTLKRSVKKIPGGPPGLVRYANERTVRVTPRAP